jgi:hypothetical protein
MTMLCFIEYLFYLLFNFFIIYFIMYFICYFIIVLYMITYFASVHLLVWYINLNIPVLRGYAQY